MSAERMIQWQAACWFTLQREWSGIDRLRIDKFMTLTRHIIHRTLRLLSTARMGETDRQVQHEPHLATGPLQNTLKSRGLCLHITDVFVTELAKRYAFRH